MDSLIQDALSSSGTDGREERGDRTAQALLESARSAFALHGFAGASVRDIAGDAGVNPSLVRYHFGSKEGLYRRVLDHAMQGLRERLLAAVSQPGSPRQRIHRVIDLYLEHLASQRDIPRLIQRALLNRESYLRELVANYLQPLLQALKPFIAAPLHPRLGSLEDVIISMFGAIIAPFLYEPLLVDLFDRDVLSQRALDKRRRHIAALVDLTLDELLQHQDGA